jgi:hypothetical protein
MRLSSVKPGSAATERSDSRVGERLGRYQLTAWLGQGGMGAVYAAIDLKLQRPVAIKILPEAISADPEAAERFLREARAAAQLNDPHIVAVYDVDHEDRTPYLVMELVNGSNAQEFLNEHGPFPWREATLITADVCRALATAHRAGLVHRDMKPANIMRSTTGLVKLADFGLAKMTDQLESSHSAAGHLLGTPSYMSPEQCRFDAVDDRSDIYSLGATYFGLLTGRPPFRGDHAVQVMFGHCSSPVPDVRQINPTVPAECQAVLERTMAKLPQDRYVSAGELLAELEQLLAAHSRPGEAEGLCWDEFLRERRREFALEGGAAFEQVGLPKAGRGKRIAITVCVALLAVVSLATVFRPTAEQAPIPGHGAQFRPTVVESSAATPPRELSPEELAALRQQLLDRAAAATQDRRLRVLRPALDDLSTFDARYGDQAGSNVSILSALRKMVEFRESVTETGREFPFDMAVTALAFSPNRQSLAIGGSAGDTGIVLLSVINGDVAFDHRLNHFNTGEIPSVSAVAFSPDSKMLLGGTSGGKLLAWTWPEKRPVASARIANSESIRDVVLSGDGQRTAAIVVGTNGVATLKVWEGASLTPLLNVSDTTSEAVSLTFVPPDDRWIGVAAKDGRIRLRDAFTGESVGDIDAHVASPKFAFSPDGALLAVAGKRYVQIWDAPTRTRIALIEVPGGEATCVAFSADGRWLVSGGGTEIGGVVTVWDVVTRRELKSFRGHTARVRAVAVLAGGDMIASGGDDQSVRLWDTSNLAAEAVPPARIAP